jgi:hypothetical protein
LRLADYRGGDGVRAEGVEEVGDVSGWGSPKAFVPWPKFGRLNPVNHLPFELLSWLALKSSFAITRVERSLYERANGYSYDAVKIFMPAGADKPVYAPYVEHMPPDATACIFWMKNRMPERWSLMYCRHLLAEEQGPGELARRPERRSRARQVHHQRSPNDGGAMGRGACDDHRRDSRRGAAGFPLASPGVTVDHLDQQ